MPPGGLAQALRAGASSIKSLFQVATGKQLRKTILPTRGQPGRDLQDFVLPKRQSPSDFVSHVSLDSRDALTGSNPRY